MPQPGFYGIARQNEIRPGSPDGGRTAGNSLSVQDTGPDVGYMIYVYNILDREYVVNQPPLFPSFHIPACKKGEKFSYTLLPAFVNEVYNRAGTYETYTKRQDGRKAAMSLLNPSAFPSTDWANQVREWDSPDQFGNNLNAYGVFWSLTRPDQTERLNEELAIFQKRARGTMQQVVRDAERYFAEGGPSLRQIGVIHHFAADYLGISAPWHTPMHHMVSCPNCGDPVREGIAYHKNAFNEKCIIDPERYAKLISIAQPKPPVIEEDEPEGELVAAVAPKRRGRPPKAEAQI